MRAEYFATTGFKNQFISSTIVDGSYIKHRFESEQSLLFFPPQNNGKGDSASREFWLLWALQNIAGV